MGFSCSGAGWCDGGRCSQREACQVSGFRSPRWSARASVRETFGRWGSEALSFLRDAAIATCERTPQLAYLGSWGPTLLLGAWHARLSVALQKANAACILQAGRVRGAEDIGGGNCWPGWEEDVEDLIRDAAAAASAGNEGW